jgi:hypothetical protein
MGLELLEQDILLVTEGFDLAAMVDDGKPD